MTGLLPDGLVQSMRSGLCVTWCGAGVSMTAGLPGWNSLARELIDMSEREAGLGTAETEELRNLADRGDFDDVMDYCRSTLGEGTYRDVLSSLFERTSQPSELHRLVTSLPTVATFTTNYDRLLESGYVEAFGSMPTVLTNRDTTTLWRRFSRREQFILKVHGDITRPETVVLSTRDYTEHIFGNLPFMQFLQRVLMSTTVLFLGSSITDIYLRRLLEETVVLTGGLGMQHYAVLIDCGPIRARLLRERFNVTPVILQSYRDVGPLLVELAEIGRSDL